MASLIALVRTGVVRPRHAVSALARQRQAPRLVRWGGGGGPAPPTFARLPAATQKLNADWELIWHDGVAPEVAIDFDAPHISRTQGVLWFLGGLSFFASIGILSWLSDPPTRKLTSPRELPYNSLKEELGGWERATAITRRTETEA